MPYTHKKVGTKFVVYKKGKKVGETEGTKIALDKYLAALHIADKKTAKKESKELKESVMEMPMDGHPGCEDTIGQIYIVMKPGPEDSAENLVHPTHVFGMNQVDPNMVHGVYQDEKQANGMAETAVNALQEHLEEMEMKKNTVTEKIAERIKMLQQEINQHLEEASMEEGVDPDQLHMSAEAKMNEIKALREKSKMVQASKKPIKQKEDKK
jgi:hypothetical protein